MEPVLKLDSVFGGYSRNKPVIHDVSFTVSAGEMVGLIGLNGAGKSTTIKHILGLMEPHSGRIFIHGQSLADQSTTYRHSYAYVPESPLLYEELTVEEHLQLSAMAYGLDQSTYEQRSQVLLEQFQMENKANSFSAHLSKGMKQKVMIMSAFLVQPSLYMIDEPFLGLDPLGIRSLLERLVEVKKEGGSILMSSHILSTIEKYCDRFIVLHRGRVIANGNLEQLCEQADQKQGTPLEELFYTFVGQNRGDKL